MLMEWFLDPQFEYFIAFVVVCFLDSISDKHAQKVRISSSAIDHALEICVLTS